MTTIARCVILAVAAGLVPWPGRSQCLPVGAETKLVQSPRVEDNRFGIDVAIDGDTALVTDAVTTSVEVHVRSGGTWSLQAILTPTNAVDDGDTCMCVALDGDLAAVGNCDYDAAVPEVGAVYVFERIGAAWRQQAILVADDAVPGDRFGASVAISGMTIVVGAPQRDEGARDSGVAYVFVGDGAGAWRQEARLVPPVALSPWQFGHSVAIDADTIVVGRTAAWWQSLTCTGDAFVFERSAGSWTLEAQLVASDASAQDMFGVDVAIDRNLIVVGAQTHDHVAADAGAAYVYRRGAASWVQEAELLAADGRAYDSLGFQVGISGYLATAAAPWDDNATNDGGSAYAFSGASGSWLEQIEVRPSDPIAEHWFGYAGEVSGDTLVAGAVFDGGRAIPGYGAAYVICLDAPPPPEADCANGRDDDGDALTDCADVDCRTDPACDCAPPPCIPTEVSDVRAGEPPLLLRRGSSLVTFERESQALTYSLYAGALGSWHAAAPVSPIACHVTTWVDNGDGTVTVAHDLAADSWLLVTASSRAGEGTPGDDSLGAERHAHGTWTDCGPSP